MCESSTKYNNNYNWAFCDVCWFDLLFVTLLTKQSDFLVDIQPKQVLEWDQESKY